MSASRARDAGFIFPPEWAPHEACVLAYPYLAHEWGEAFHAARREWIELCRAIALEAGEDLILLVPGDREEAELREALRDAAHRCRFLRLPYGDAWTRDTAPLILMREDGERAAACLRFNNWGGKFELPGDRELSARLAEALGFKAFPIELVAEGGAIEVDGEGNVLTTFDCIKDDNRNPGLELGELEERLHGALGTDRAIWLKGALINDHTDGHIDTIARFVGPREVAVMLGEEGDPNRALHLSLIEQLKNAQGDQGLKLHILPSPGAVRDESTGELLAASYCNFYIGNDAVIVPLYGVPADARALECLEAIFPDRRVVGRSSRAIIRGGGSFHCITQQIPRPLRAREGR